MEQLTALEDANKTGAPKGLNSIDIAALAARVNALGPQK